MRLEWEAANFGAEARMSAALLLALLQALLLALLLAGECHDGLSETSGSE